MSGQYITATFAPGQHIRLEHDSTASGQYIRAVYSHPDLREVGGRDLPKRLDREEVMVGARQVGGGDKREAADVAPARQLRAARAAAGARVAAGQQHAFCAHERRPPRTLRVPLWEAHLDLGWAVIS